MRADRPDSVAFVGYDSIRPDLKYIRSGGREGSPMGCGGTCPMCRGAHQEQDRRRSPRRLRDPLPERDEDRPPKDPRYNWLPP